MASSMFLQLISKKLVKPSVLTPPSLRNYKLSLMDQLMKNTYMPMACFYPNPHHKRPDQTSSLLEESLSKALASYYPFAGKLKDDISINCSDTGATFIEARIKHCTMSEILNADNVNAQDIVYPSGLPWRSVSDDQPSLVVAQLSHFDCGGKGLSVCMAHKLGDGHTLCNFINDWAALARGQSSNVEEKSFPHFIGASILPPKHDLSIGSADLKQGHHCITRRYVFDSKKLSELKAKAAAQVGVQNPTRVEVVSALLYKCAMSAAMVYTGSFKPSALAFIVNLRQLMRLPAATQNNYAGNLASNFSVSTGDEKEVNFARLVSEIRREKVLHYEKYKGIDANGLVSTILENAQRLTTMQDENFNGYICSSFCKFPTYRIDFGWGRPIRVSFAAAPYNNFFLLMDNDNLDGIEALVTLEEQVMSIFQNDPEFLAFTSSPSF